VFLTHSLRPVEGNRKCPKEFLLSELFRNPSWKVPKQDLRVLELKNSIGSHSWCIPIGVLSNLGMVPQRHSSLPKFLKSSYTDLVCEELVGKCSLAAEFLTQVLQDFLCIQVMIAHKHLHYEDGHIHKWFTYCSHDFTGSSPPEIGLSHSNNNNVNWMWKVPSGFPYTSYRSSALWRHWEVFTRYSHTLHLMHVRLRKWLRSCNRWGTIPIHDLADFTHGSQLLLIMPDFSTSEQVPIWGKPHSQMVHLLFTW